MPIYNLKEYLLKFYTKVSSKLAVFTKYQFRIHKKFDHVEVRNYSDSTEFSEISIINSNFYNLSLNLSADENLMKP